MPLLLAGTLALAPGCLCSEAQHDSSGGGGSAGEAAAGGVGGGTGGATGGGAGAGGDAAATCYGGPKSPAIPAGWKRFPGLPCECDVWLAPDPSLMGPAPKWITTPPGVLELEDNWADPAHRFYLGTTHGDSWQGKQYLGMLRDLGDHVEEVVIIRLPDSQLVFQARVPEANKSPGCRARVEALSQGVGLYHGREAPPGIAPTKHRVYASASPPKAEPVVFHAEETSIAPYVFAVSSEIAACVVEAGRIDAFALDGSATYLGAWTASGTGLAGNSTLGAWDGELFFDLQVSSYGEEAWVWDADNGPRALVPVTGGALGQVGSSCAVGTDGNVMVWSQSSGAVFSGAPGESWQENDLMIAPYTTDPAKLAPKKLRSLPGPRSSCVRWKVQAGYAGSYELFDPNAGSWNSKESVLVRLSDGVMWTIPRRTGRYFSAAKYITPTEVALVEGLTLPNDAGVTEFESWSIVRYPIALLGPGDSP